MRNNHPPTSWKVERASDKEILKICRIYEDRLAQMYKELRLRAQSNSSK